MFAPRAARTPASMSDPRVEMPLVNWSELGVSDSLPIGTVTLLLADVEGSTRLWEHQPDEMTAAVALLDRTLCDVIAKHNGVRPVEQRGGDSFVAAFGRASDAVACALELQRAPLAPIRLRIGVHTGRGSTTRRSQLHRPGDQPDRTPARPRARRPDRAVGHHRRSGRRPAPDRCVADRSGHPSATRSAPARTGGAAVPSRPS
jgi:hypothetical protein